jgi:surface protein
MSPILSLKLGIINLNSPKFSETGFVFTVKTDNTGTSNDDQFTLPLHSTFDSSGGTTAEVDWGDGSSDTITAHDQSEITHTYASAGTYTIKITNELRGWSFSNTGDKLKVLNISNWGVFEHTTFRAFQGCANLTLTATDAPTFVISGSPSTNRANSFFNTCSQVNGPVNQWDISGIINLTAFFSFASLFNQPLNNWDVSSVTTFNQTFRSASSFNQDISSWSINTSSSVDMQNMFLNNSAFNTSIDNWDVSEVTNMNQMFRGSVYNQQLNSWDVSNVTNMQRMLSFPFSGVGGNFNQPLSNWNVGNVTNMKEMFKRNDAFNQDISSWNIVKVSNATGFMQDCDGFSTANYDALLIGWEATLQSAHPGGSGYTLTPSWHFGNAQYTDGGAAATARASLISNFNWSITDGGTA